MTCVRILLGAVVVLTVAVPARADNIDLKLYGEAYKVAEQIRKHGYKTVGVLNFRSQKGAAAEGFTHGTISTSMATRLERALVLHDPADNPYLLVKDVSATAQARRVGGWHRSPVERAKLFGITYPAMWGGTTAKPDALITGVVRLNQDLSITTVTIEAYSAKAPDRPVKLHEFSVGTDRSVLHEFGQTYVVASSALAGKRSIDRDRLAVQSAARRDVGTADTPASADDVAGLSLKILYNGQPQAIVPDPNSAGEYRVDPPTAGTTVTFHVQNTGSRTAKMGAALSLNGQSFWKQEKGEVTNGQVWLFDAGKGPIEFRGFYMDHAGENLIPFKVLTAEESKARVAEFGDKVGLIQMDVFEPRAQEAEDEMKISLARGFTALGKSGKFADLKDAKKGVYTSDRKLFKQLLATPTARDRGLIVPEDEAKVPGGDLKIESFDNPVRVGGIIVRYYSPSQSD